MLRLIVFTRNIDHSTAREIKFSIKDFFSEYEQICFFLRIWSHLLKKSLTGILSQPVFSCLDSTMKAPGNCVKFVQS